MDIRIGIINAPREVGIELPDDTSIDELKATIEAAVAAGAGLVWLTDRKGRQTGFPAGQIGYIEIGNPHDDQRIGFS